jgi:type IV pilus assembly protein PilQ
MKYSQPLSARWLIILITLAAALHGCAAKAPKAAEQQAAKVVLTSVEPREIEGKTEIVIAGDGPIMQYTSFQLTDPLRLIVDIADAEIGALQERIAVESGAVSGITPSQNDNIARLELGLTQSVDSRVYLSDGSLIIELGKPSEEALQEEAFPEKGTATVVTGVQASAGTEGVKVVITADGTMVPKDFMVAGNRLVLDIPDTRSQVKPSVIPVRKGGLDKVRVGQHMDPEQKVRVVLDLTRDMQYTITPEGNTLRIALTEATTAQAEKKEAPAAAPKKAVTPPLKKTPAAAPKKEAPAPPATADEERLAGGGRYTGRKISLDLQDADLVNVMRLFAEVANLNVILAPDVKGRVTVRLMNIPWDQAMDIILRMNGLGYVREDNILRVASIGALTREAEEVLRSKEAKKKAEDLVTRIVPINYATAAEIDGTIKKSLSARGETVTDTRTNTLIVKDLAQNVEEVVSLIKLLDKPIPQIMIEARIVEASTSFNRDLGIQWGGRFQADAARGNPTGLVFPNSVDVTGGPTMGVPPSGNGQFLVNMPAAAGPGGGGAIGFRFGSLSKALNLDLVLSALESTGEGKIISSPRVSALDNKEAKISSGQSIPYSTTSAGGTQTSFIDASLSLTVTPHATPDNKIFMKINASKNEPGSITGAGGQPSISKNEATTEILLSDGETAVIGGIITTRRTTNYQKVPFFGDLPFIGWLFKKQTTDDRKSELLIFITPRVVKQEVI